MPPEYAARLRFYSFYFSLFVFFDLELHHFAWAAMWVGISAVLYGASDQYGPRA